MCDDGEFFPDEFEDDGLMLLCWQCRAAARNPRRAVRRNHSLLPLEALGLAHLCSHCCGNRSWQMIGAIAAE